MKYNVVALFLVLIFIIIGGISELIRRIKILHFQHKEVAEISREQYETKSKLYLINPTMHSQNRKFVVPSDNQLSYFKVVIKDKGYQEEHPIEVKVFFIIDGNDDLMENNCFIVHTSVDEN